MYLQIGAVLSIVLGLMSCFAGYRLFRVVLAIAGFFAGAALAGGLFWTFFPQQPEFVAVIVGLVGGIIGAVLLGFFYFAGVFVAGVALGVLLGSIISVNLGWQRVLASIILGLSCGILALALQKLLIVIATAFIGAWSVLGGIALLMGWALPMELVRQPPVFWSTNWGTAFLVAWLVLGGFGVAVQYQPGREHAAPAPSERAH